MVFSKELIETSPGITVLSMGYDFLTGMFSMVFTYKDQRTLKEQFDFDIIKLADTAINHAEHKTREDANAQLSAYMFSNTQVDVISYILSKDNWIEWLDSVKDFSLKKQMRKSSDRSSVAGIVTKNDMEL